MFYYISAMILVLLTVFWFQRNKNLPPGPWNLPILGYLLSINEKAPHETFTKLARKYGPVYSLRLGNVFAVVLSDAKIVRKVFSQDIVTGRPELYVTHGIMNGYGLIGASGELWKDQRKFAIGCLRSFGMVKNSPKRKNIETLIMDQVNEFETFIKQQMDTSNELTLDPMETLRHNIGSILNLLIFGKSWPRDDATWLWLQHLQEEGVKHIGVSGPLNFLPFLRFIPKFNKQIDFLLEGQKETHAFYQTLINEQEAIMEKLSVDGECSNFDNFIQMFLYERKKRANTVDFERFYNDTQLYHFLADLFGAGLDTSLVTLRWLLLYLALNPEVQNKLHEEIKEVLGGRKPSLDDMSNLPILDATVAEAQRIRSVVPLGIPHTNSCEMEIEGYKIPKNSMIVPLQWAIHMDPEKWDCPEKFNPLRFINEEGRCVKPDNFIPFQLGKRMCLGDEFAKMMLFLFSATIFQEFEISAFDNIDLRGEHGITLCPHPHKLSFKRRL